MGRSDHFYEQVAAGAGGHTCGLVSNGDGMLGISAGAAPGAINGPFHSKCWYISYMWGIE